MAVATLPIAPTPTIAITGDRDGTAPLAAAWPAHHPGDADYDDARRVLYFTVDRRPLAIVRAADARDVAAAVNFARDHALPAGGAQRRPQPRVPQRDRRRDRRRPLGDGARQHRPRGADRPRPAGRHLRRPRRPGERLRPGALHRRHPFGRHGRADDRRRHRLHGAQVRPRHRQPALGAGRHGRGRHRDRQRRASTRTSSGRSAAAAATSASSPSSCSAWRRSGRSWAAS